MRLPKSTLALTVILSLGVGIACNKPASAPVADDDGAKRAVAEAAAEAQRKAAEEAARLKAEEEARLKNSEADRLRAEEEARRNAEAAKTSGFKAAAEAALKDINFDFDQSAIRVPDKAKLQTIASFLKANAQVSLNIEGHCDERGTEQYNMALGERRANAAQKYLVSLGVAESRLRTISYGKEKPKMEGHSEESWFVNRRCEFKMK